MKRGPVAPAAIPINIINTYRWDYDDAGRLVFESFDSHDDTLDYTDILVWDWTGNRQSITRDWGDDHANHDYTTTYHYDANDRLTHEIQDFVAVSVPDQMTTYGYGDPGQSVTQQTSKTIEVGGVPRTVQSSEYNLQGRLSEVTTTQFESDGTTVSSIQVTRFEYDSAGNRIAMVNQVDLDGDGSFETRTRTEYLTDTKNATGYSQVLQETEFDGSGPIKKTVYAIGHDQISQTTFERSTSGQSWEDGTSAFFGTDGHGNVRVLLNLFAKVLTDAQSLVQVYHFDAFGNLLNFGPGQQPSTSYLYSGESFNFQIGQQYLRARYYDPVSGRFNRLDPFFGNSSDPQSFHKYAYVHGDPIQGVDPSGKWLIPLVAGAGTALGAFAGGLWAYMTGRSILGGALLGGALGFIGATGALWGLFGLWFTFGFAGGSALLFGGASTVVGGGSIAQIFAYNMTIRSQQGAMPSSAQAQHDFDYALLALDVYEGDFHNTQQRLKERNWLEGRRFKDNTIGYNATIYRNYDRNELVMVYEGTITIEDWANNIAQGFGVFGQGGQYLTAKSDALFARSQARAEGLTLRFVGHSLGGGLATAAALHVGAEATTFNAAGINPLNTDRTMANELVTNYRVRGEALTTLQDSMMFGWLMPNSSRGDTFWLTPEADDDPVFRHTGAIIPSMERLLTSY